MAPTGKYRSAQGSGTTSAAARQGLRVMVLAAGKGMIDGEKLPQIVSTLRQMSPLWEQIQKGEVSFEL